MKTVSGSWVLKNKSMKKNAFSPIGVFDSGIGGISLLKCMREAMPCEDFIYIADSFFAPYGNKPKGFIEKRALSISRFLIEKNAKAIVVACNTATAAAISTMRSLFNLPVIGMEPGVKPAISITKTGTVGILATTETLNSEKFKNLVERFCCGCNIVTQDCPGLVEKIEEIRLLDEETLVLIKKYLSSLLSRGADTIVLGCTHYLFLTDIIREIAGDQVKVIDTGTAVTREVIRRLKEEGLMTEKKETGDVLFYTSGSREKTADIIDRIWDDKVAVESLPEKYTS